MDQGEQFLDHCHENNISEVKKCLSRGVDVNTVSGDGDWSGLIIAAWNDYSDLVDLLLAQPDIKINNTTRHFPRLQWTALMFACEAGNPDIVSRLVEVPGLDINYQDEDGKTAAHCVSANVNTGGLFMSDEDHTDCVRILAETGRVDWNKRDKRGCTPLYSAMCSRRSDIVDIMLEQPNIDYNVKTEGGNTLAQLVVHIRNVRWVETFAAEEQCHCWNVPASNGDTPIMWALKQDITEIVEILLRCPRVDLTCRDKKGWSLVFRAIQKNQHGKKFKIIMTFL